MSLKNDTRRIYVRPLASYTAGSLYGEWIDADQDADTIREEIAEMMKNSPTPDAEEWAIHDYEGFDGIKLSEHESIDTVAELAKALDEHGEPFAVWYANESRDSVDTDRFQEQYRGTYRTLEDYAEQFLDDLGTFDNCNDTLKTYFDYERFARDMELGGDIWTHEGGDGVFVFDNH